jgi:Flavin containing amine oxidoreductase/SWIRM domain
MLSLGNAMFTIDSADTAADTDALDDHSFIFTSTHHDLLSIPLPTENADSTLDLKVASANVIPFSSFDHIVYEQYNESGSSSVQYGDLNDVSEMGGSHISSKDEGDGSTSTSNGYTNGFQYSHAPSLQSHPNGRRTYHYEGLNMRTEANRQVKFNGSSPASEQPRGNSAPVMGCLNKINSPIKPNTQLDGVGSPLSSSKKSPRLILYGPHLSTTPELSQSQESSFNNTRTPHNSPTKKKVLEFRARSSIPSSLAPEEFARQGILAAYSSRLNPFALNPGEYKLLREHISYPQITIYLNIRNAILRLWTKNPLVSVTVEEAVGCAKETRFFNMAKVAYYWLMRNGYINFGCVEVSSTAGSIPRMKAKGGKRRTVVIIGAGMSGLGCARQLEGLFAQFGDRWTNEGERTPKLIVLEGRSRVGGRVYSHPLQNQADSTLPYGLRCTAEMGAQIVTGFEHGNPMNAIIRGQLAIPYHALRDNTVLYDHDGEIVEKSRDILVEKLYNDILERASVYRNKPMPLRTVEGDRGLIGFGRDPSGEGGAMISTLEDSGAPITAIGINIKTATEDKPSSGVEKLAGRAYLLTSGLNSNMSAAGAAKAMGWELKTNITETQSLDLDPIALASDHPTLGETMDEAIRQYQDILNLTPRDMRLLNWHHANLEYANAITVNQLSLGGWDQDIGNEFEGEHSEIIGGYQQIPRGLWQCPTKLDVRFNCVVESVRYNLGSEDHTKPVSIQCKNGEVFEADRLVITTPLGVLKEGSITFDPPLPAWKIGAIERLGFGLLNKVSLN